MIELFFTFFKTGLFTIGGGYVMISLIKEICVEKKHWLDNAEFLDLLAISESTPGPIAINLSTYIGYKRFGLKGAIISTFALILPSFICIYIISLFFEDLFDIAIVRNAFIGIRIAVSMIIIKVATKMFINEYKSSNDKFMILLLFLTILITIIIASFSGYSINTIQVLLFVLVLSIVLLKVKKL